MIIESIERKTNSMSIRSHNEGGRTEGIERQHDVSQSTLQKSGRGIQT